MGKLLVISGVFRTKLQVDRSLDKYKSKVVAKGFQQTDGIDYAETFRPVVKPTTIRVVLNLVMLDSDNKYHQSFEL